MNSSNSPLPLSFFQLILIELLNYYFCY